MPARPAPIAEFLALVRFAAARRAVVVALARLVVGVGVVGGGAIALVMATARGDLGRYLGTAALLAWGLGVAVWSWRAWRLEYRSVLVAARTLARERRAEPPGLSDELLAAAELEDPEALPPAQSRELAEIYVSSVADRVGKLAPQSLVRPLPVARMAVAMLLAVAVPAGLTATSAGRLAWDRLRSGVDGRPPRPPTPIWSSLQVELTYPEHTRRPPRQIPNPSGALRAPAGTLVALDVRLTEPADVARLVVNYDAPEPSQAPAPTVVTLTPAADQRWQGSFVLRSSGVWTVALFDEADDQGATARATSPPARLELEPDNPPELELLPLPADQREPTEIDRIDLRFRARDDFGLGAATLVYELADGTRRRLPAGDGEGRRAWQQRTTWDLAAVPIDRRGELTYFIEIRDNDPGLGLVPLPDPPGKVVRSARHKLLVRDEESEHARNVESLRGIRDRAVDMLALRMTAAPFTTRPAEADVARRHALLGEARHIHLLAQGLLTRISDTVDALALDRMVPPREVRILIEVHRRLYELHRAESALHEQLPPGGEATRPSEIPKLLQRIARHNPREVSQLEDDIIRLDDLVDGQIVADLERLLARLQASQQKLLELLEKLAAGDESVREQIDQLEQRIREDMRRVSSARARLRKEVGDEYMNLDAFKAIEDRLKQQNLRGSLERGDTEDALRAARETLDQIGQLRDAVGQRAASDEDARLSPEERARMELLRGLSRLKDDQTQLTRESSGLERRWRELVEETDLSAERGADTRARASLRSLEAINDARLGREGRRGYEDARAQLEALERLADTDAPDPLALFDAARLARRGLEQARAGAESGEREAKALERLLRRVRATQAALFRALPQPAAALPADQRERSQSAAEGQRSLEQRLSELAQRSPAGDLLPPPGQSALRMAGRAMRDAAGAFGTTDPIGAGEASRDAVEGIERAIESLRRSNPPPPPPQRAQEASTEAERDRSLRDALMEAMRENPPDGYDEPIERYYEELLQ
ncbi:MAG: hypothetical protein B7733_26520 [Myxococcales bacterium FL481]|nr:MAG: hypothetical protein B7733_26520 [Myxococcales bacterium FL481]